jgi:hypothetical protein
VQTSLLSSCELTRCASRTNNNTKRGLLSHKQPKRFCRSTTVADGSHNVSRWMTWLPISLKNAAKCDKWYQLQNLSITESLNANGAWKKALVVQLQACHVSVSNKNQKITRQILLLGAQETTQLVSLRAGEVALSVPASVGPIWSIQKTLLVFF